MAKKNFIVAAGRSLGLGKGKEAGPGETVSLAKAEGDALVAAGFLVAPSAADKAAADKAAADKAAADKAAADKAAADKAAADKAAADKAAADKAAAGKSGKDGGDLI